VVIAMTGIAVFGGSGFLGRAIVEQLVAAGMTARAAVRHPDTMKVPDATARQRIDTCFAQTGGSTRIAWHVQNFNPRRAVSIGFQDRPTIGAR
jgi:uncharacterized protein YbjT (DUF2867 family)